MYALVGSRITVAGPVGARRGAPRGRRSHYFCISSASWSFPEHYFCSSNASSSPPEHHFCRASATWRPLEHYFFQSSASWSPPEHYCPGSGVPRNLPATPKALEATSRSGSFGRRPTAPKSSETRLRRLQDGSKAAPCLPKLA